MDFQAKISSGKLLFANQAVFADWEKRQKEGDYIVTIKKPTRSSLQNRSIHLFFRWIADSLNEKHLYFNQNFFNPDFEIEWNSEMVKNLIWRPIQKSYMGEKSTTKLKSNEIGEIAEIIQKNFSEKFGIILNFPNEFDKYLNVEPFEIVK